MRLFVFNENKSTNMRVLRNPSTLLVQTPCFNGDEKVEAQSGGGHGNPLQYCLENPMERGDWRLQATQSPRVRHDWAAEQRKDMTWGARYPPLSIFGSQKNQRNVKWVPYQFTPRSGWSWRNSFLQGDKRMEVGCDQALPYWGSGKTPPRSCCWGLGNYLSILFFSNPDGSIFFLILGASLPPNFSSSLKDSRVYFCAFQQRVWLIISEKAAGVAQCPMVSQWRNKLAPWLELSKLASQGLQLNTLLLLLFVFKRAL